MEHIKAQVYMLPTKDEFSLIGKYEDTGNLFLRRKDDIPRGIPQHLYFTDDSEIKEGDWYIANQAPRLCVDVRKGNKYPYGHKNDKGEMIYDFHTWRTKIVATTNPELWYGNRYVNNIAVSEYLSIPKIDTPFIEAYIKAYNEGNPIKEVLLGVEEKDCGNTCTGCEDSKWCISVAECEHNAMNGDAGRATGDKSNFWKETRLELKSNGSVIIYPVKERMYTKEDMFTAYCEGCRISNPFGDQGLSKYEKRNWKEWFNKNYPN